MANASVVIYNTSREPVADLNNAYEVGVEQRINELSRAWFHLPIDDVHVLECTHRRYAEIYNGDTRVDLFRIIQITTADFDGKKYYRYDCEHVLATLQDHKVNAALYGTTNTTTSIGEILVEQPTANWQLGTCVFTEAYLYEWVAGTSLLAALLSIPKRFGCNYQ